MSCKTNEPAQSGASTPDAPQFSRFGTEGLEGYLAANRSKFTEDALRDAAFASGWDASIVETTLGAVRDAERSAPTRARAHRLVRLLYIAAFLALSTGMIVNVQGMASVGIPILGATLATAYFFGSVWMRSRRIGAGESARAGAILLVVPVTVWLALTGLCLATGMPTRGFIL